ncbi:MAG: hypothetical protein HXY50_02185 [Ignavibacteriaceae bacterium]|nr:hypothetical protein [Ignavibacteriaceae bacterium]
MTTTVDFLKTLNSLHNIGDTGFIYEAASEVCNQKRKDLESRFDEFETCCEWIQKFRFHPTERQIKKYVQVQTYNSYFLKHLVEKWSGKYISNGAFIAAVRFLGISSRPIYGTPDLSVTIFLKPEATLI